MIDVKRVETDKKPISEMTEREILRQQLELLAERSQNCMDEELSSVCNTMLSIATYLSSKDESVFIPEDSNGKCRGNSVKMSSPYSN